MSASDNGSNSPFLYINLFLKSVWFSLTIIENEQEAYESLYAQAAYDKKKNVFSPKRSLEEIQPTQKPPLAGSTISNFHWCFVGNRRHLRIGGVFRDHGAMVGFID